MNSSLLALTGFVAWTLLLLVLMESLRSRLVLLVAGPSLALLLSL